MEVFYLVFLFVIGIVGMEVSNGRCLWLEIIILLFCLMVIVNNVDLLMFSFGLIGMIVFVELLLILKIFLLIGYVLLWFLLKI